jgi:chromosomal replication initiator protein
MIRVADIQSAVAQHYGVSLDVMRGSRGTWKQARQRQVAIALASRLTDHSYARIGHFFGGRDHSTVIHACKVVANDPKVQDTLRKITLDLCQVPLSHIGEIPSLVTQSRRGS